MATNTKPSGQQLKETIKAPTLDLVKQTVLEYRSKLKVKPDHLEGLLFLALDGGNRRSMKRVAIPILAKLAEMLTEKNLNAYLNYVLDKRDVDDAGFLIRRMITFFHTAFSDEYLETALQLYEIEHEPEFIEVPELQAIYKGKLTSWELYDRA